MKKADFLKRVAQKTATSEPVFAVAMNRGWTNYYIAAKRANDTYVFDDNGVSLQQIRFNKDGNNATVDLIGHPVMKRLNVVSFFSNGYEQAWVQITEAAEAARREREEREAAYELDRQARLRDERVVAELQPIIKELLASTGVSVSGAYGDQVKITISASQLEGFIEFLSHTVSE